MTREGGTGTGTAAAPRRAAVLGSPIAHSLSPLLHRAAYARLGLSGWTYERHDVNEAALPGFLNGLDRDGGGRSGGGEGGGGSDKPTGTWAGLSLTMPLKRAVIPLLDEVDPTASAVNAVNTLIFRPDGSRYGANTDVTGLAAALRERGIGPTSLQSAAVLGAGATAGSALAALSDIVKGPITIYLRNPAKLAEFDTLVRHFALELEPRPWQEARNAATFDLVINTTPAGAADDLADPLPQQVGTLFDVLYHPWPTPLAAAWSARGGEVLGGQDLLVHQAVRQVELMTGIEARSAEILTAMREALRSV
jgi:shikimate dehydrogenase